jgi:hypothetical protein
MGTQDAKAFKRVASKFLFNWNNSLIVAQHMTQMSNRDLCTIESCVVIASMYSLLNLR